ncbi:uncharacterized protein LOC142972896 [Anticarsia gemmatalis]|uniref:uncharacterized protein LOC142972896 n=1 Tax=Anticarsia gemmatalis TaxID=129554 RepID=UPI003F7754C4
MGRLRIVKINRQWIELVGLVCRLSPLLRVSGSHSISHLAEVIRCVNSLAMVKLPENESYVPLPTGEMFDRYQSNRNLYLNGGPSRLIELEEFADIAANYMSTLSNYPNIRQIAMNRLRQLFNLEFKMRCDVCGTAHNQDEISAPER